MKNYDLICIVEGYISANNKKDARREMEDILANAFDNEAAKSSNPCIIRTRVSVGGEGSISCVHRAAEEEMRADYLESMDDGLDGD